MNPIALITGATAGIGEATALRFAAEGYDLIIAGRRQQRLDKLAPKLEKAGAKVLKLSFDVQDKGAVGEALNSIPDKWQKISVLVNNAGLAWGFGSMQEGKFEHWDTMIDTNVKGLLYVSRLIAPMMIRQKSGHIINVGSIAGKEVYPNGNVYAATKHAVDALSKAMRIDLLNEGIRVTNIAPGAVETEFSLVRFDWDKTKAKDVYKGFKPLEAADVADTIYYAASRPAHININDLIVMPAAQASTAYIKKQK